MVKVVPAPSALSAADGAAVQADQLLHQRQPDSAALVGSRRGRVSIRWNRSNNRGISAAGTPMPVSETVTTASAAVADAPAR